ncbi:hypothetical protein ASAP_1957 [Asaia bogorensis]|uniref:Uncharacterized protein n=1 Tax=Asaia bogorensis TaxID=91915 RepID=A0A060QL44_9PROT|nr:hypothetical protein P792_09080 [Asaia sp. SF2.1]CDG40002.1 hypothetical protein ASAP_1957 [Asaia bogorensis]
MSCDSGKFGRGSACPLKMLLHMKRSVMDETHAGLQGRAGHFSP